MTMQSTSRRIALISAAALALGMGVAGAQPAGGPYGPGFGGHHGMGGPHGHAAGGAMVGGLIEKAKAQLNLNTMQQGMFDAAVADGKAARDAARARHLKARDAIHAELAAAEPNLEAVAKIADDIEAQDRTGRLAVRAQWLNLYKTFSVEQKAVVREMAQTRIARMEKYRQKMHERMQQRQGAGNG